MRKAFLAALAVASALSVAAQQKVQSQIELGTTTNIDNANGSFNLQYTAMKPISNAFLIGVGAGVIEQGSFSQDPAIPIYARLQFENFKKTTSPFFSIDGGYSFSTQGSDYDMAIINPAIGIRCNQAYFSVGYYGALPKGGGSIQNNISLRFAYAFGRTKSEGKSEPRTPSKFEKFMKANDYTIEIGADFAKAEEEYLVYHEDPDFISDKNLYAAFAITRNVWSDLSAGIVVGYRGNLRKK